VFTSGIKLHYEKEENLSRTRELVAYCNDREVATEAEPGRIEGGEDGVLLGDGDEELLQAANAADLLPQLGDRLIDFGAQLAMLGNLRRWGAQPRSGTSG